MAWRDSSVSLSVSWWRLKGGGEGAIGMASSEFVRLLIRRRARANMSELWLLAARNVGRETAGVSKDSETYDARRGSGQ